MFKLQRFLITAMATASLAFGAFHRRTNTPTHKRSPSSRSAFQRSHPCPSTGRTSGACPGCVVDHVVPLKRGGADHPSNMQWQTTEAAKAKDRVED
jgi:5-methylcytosine-specific restriction endonuclease McrA